MAKIVLIQCGSKKLSHNSKAKDLYMSTLFRYNLKFANLFNPDKIFILSAKYGLLDLEKEIEPYNKTLNSMPSKEIKKWANNVVIQLKEVADLDNDDVVFLAGEKYRKYLIPYISHYSLPLKGLRIGEQLKYLKDKTSNDRIL